MELTWSKRMSIGNEMMDSEHKSILKLVNEVDNAIRTKDIALLGRTLEVPKTRPACILNMRKSSLRQSRFLSMSTIWNTNIFWTSFRISRRGWSAVGRIGPKVSPNIAICF